MNNYIALFRGINVGGNNILPMKELKVLLQDLGCEKVQSYIQSGNVVLQSDLSKVALADAISEKVAELHGFTPKVMLLDQQQFAEAIRNTPFPTDEGKALHFYFLGQKAISPDLAKLEQLKVDSESFQLIGEVFYLHAPDGIGRSKLAAKVEQCLGVATTARNWNTVKKIADMVDVS